MQDPRSATDYDIKLPIDIKAAIQCLGYDEDTFYTMLASLESLSITPCLANMVEIYDKSQADEFKKQAHALKGASAYIGASKLHYVCYFI